MDLLSFLKEKKNNVLIEQHPFYDVEDSVKYIYCFGLGVLAYGHMKAITETEQVFKELLDAVNLHESYRNNIIIDINNNFDRKLDEVLLLMDTKENQYTFCADLIKLSSVTLWAQKYTEGVLDTYMRIFKLSSAERDFIFKFIKAGKKKNMEEAILLYDNFISEGYEISYRLLRYMNSNFVLEEIYNGIILEHGEHKYIDRPTTINGSVIISKGSSLTIRGAKVKIHGSIFVDGGRFHIIDSYLQVIGSTQPNLITITNSAAFRVTGTEIDCNFKCGFLQQEQGFLIIEDCKISHTKFRAAVEFTGIMFQLKNSTLEDCLNGGIIVKDEASMSIENCSFYNCESDHGGGIYFNSIYDGIIINSRFKNCRGKYIGGAIYFTYKKYEQEILGCEFIDCLPKDSNIFNYYKAENNLFL